MAGRDAREDVRPKPPPGPRPRGSKKEKGEANESSPRKGDRERRDSRSKGDGGAETEKSPKKSNRRSHRRSKESLITSDNWRQHFDDYNSTNNSDAFSQHSRGSLNLYFTPLSAEDMIRLTKALAGNIPLRSLCLSNCSISDDQCQKIIDSLSKNTHIKRIDLSWNPISEASAPCLVEFAKAHPNMDELNVLGSSLTQESQLRVINSFTRKASKDGSEVPKPPRPTLNTEYLNELVLLHYESANLPQVVKQLLLSDDELKYFINAFAERLWAAGKQEKVLEVLLIGHRQSPSELGFLYRLCRIYWEMGNAQTKATREMYLSVGLTFAERALLVDDKFAIAPFERWLRDFSTALAFASPHAPISPRFSTAITPMPTPPMAVVPTTASGPQAQGPLSQSMRFDRPGTTAASAEAPRPLASSMVFPPKKKDSKKSKAQELAELAVGEKLERKRSYTSENIPTMFSRDASLPAVPTKAPAQLSREYPKSDTALSKHADHKAENDELRAQISVLYEELSRMKKSSSMRESPTTSAPTTPHHTETLTAKPSKKEEELDQRIAFQIAQLSALNLQLQRLETTRKQLSTMKEEERTLHQTIMQLTRKEQKIEARRAKQQGVIGKSVYKINLKNIVINEALSRGRGGSGATVNACTVDGWSCACKELDIAELVSAGDGEEGFMQEVALLERLPYHPNIVKYLFHERVGQRIRLFMTRYHSNLTDLMATRATGFTAAAITKYALEVLAGLEFLHKHQVLHRDLKSDNIFVLLNEKKEIQQLAIGDFDVAKRLKVERPAAAAGRTVVGTPYIMAPEVLMRQEYSFPSDIFSYGMVLFEFMAMKRPYEGQLFQVPDLIMGGVPPELPQHLLSDPTFTSLVRTHRACLRLKGSERPTIEEVRAMLHTEMPSGRV